MDIKLSSLLQIKLILENVAYPVSKQDFLPYSQLWTWAVSQGDWQMSASVKPEARTSRQQCMLSPLGEVRNAVVSVLTDTRMTDPSKLRKRHEEKGIRMAA